MRAACIQRPSLVSDHRYYDRPGGNRASAGPGKCVDLEVVIRKNAILIFADPEDDDRYHQRPGAVQGVAMSEIKSGDMVWLSYSRGPFPSTRHPSGPDGTAIPAMAKP